MEEVGKHGKCASEDKPTENMGVNRKGARPRPAESGIRDTEDRMWPDSSWPFVCIKLNKPGLCLATQHQDCHRNSDRECN